MSLSQLAVLNSQSLKSQLESLGHVLVERLDTSKLDINNVPVEYKPFFSAAAGKTLPLIVIRDMKTGKVEVVEKFPESPSAFLKVLEDKSKSEKSVWSELRDEVRATRLVLAGVR